MQLQHEGEHFSRRDARAFFSQHFPIGVSTLAQSESKREDFFKDSEVEVREVGSFA